MNILTDVLSLIRRSVFAKTAGLDDVLVLGVNEEPNMTGVASPIPYKSIKVIKVRDFKVAAEHCDHANSPAIPAAGTGQVYQKTVVDPTTQKCTVFYRSLKSMSSNLTLATSTDDDYIEITTTGQPNLAANFPVGGSGTGVWKDKIGETLNFRKLIAGSNVTLATTGAGEIEISSTGGGGGSYTFDITDGTTTQTIADTDTVTLTNLGTGKKIFKQITAPNTLEFKTLKSLSSNLLIADNVDGNTIDFELEDSVQKGGLCAGKAYIKFTSGTPAGDAMTGTRFKIMGSTTIGSTVVHSPFSLDWTDSELNVFNDPSASTVKQFTNEAALSGSTDWTQTNVIPAGQISSPQGGTGLSLTTASTNPVGTGAVNASPTGFSLLAGGSGYAVNDTIAIDPGNGGASVSGIITGIDNYAMTNAAAQESIPLPIALAISDKITISWIVTNSATRAGQNFNVLLGWFDTADIVNTQTTYLRDVSKGAAFTEVTNGRTIGIGTTTTTLTAATGSGFAVFGFNFPNSATNDEYNISWTLSIERRV